jgi:hypothetical protein
VLISELTPINLLSMFPCRAHGSIHPISISRLNRLDHYSIYPSKICFFIPSHYLSVLISRLARVHFLSHRSIYHSQFCIFMFTLIILSWRSAVAGTRLRKSRPKASTLSLAIVLKISFFLSSHSFLRIIHSLPA